MARAVWSGSISFGLVNVPVKAFTAVREHTVHFNQIDAKSGQRIHYKKVAGDSDKEVDADDIELGYETSKGHYVTFEKGELDELRPQSTRTIDVGDFVDLNEIDPIYYDRTYWLAPDGEAGAKAYQLLLAAMEDQERVGVGTVVMRNKQYLTAIRPLDGALAMSTMRFADEVVDKKDIGEIPSRRSKPDERQLKLAVQIVESLATDWKPSRYHDTYTEELRSIIDKKAKGEELVVEGDTTPASDNVVDLMAALEASLQSHKGGRSAGTTAKAQKKAPAKKKAAKRKAS